VQYVAESYQNPNKFPHSFARRNKLFAAQLDDTEKAFFSSITKKKKVKKKTKKSLKWQIIISH